MSEFDTWVCNPPAAVNEAASDDSEKTFKKKLRLLANHETTGNEKPLQQIYRNLWPWCMVIKWYAPNHVNSHVVKAGFDDWDQYINLTFSRVADPTQADIRVSYDQPGYWSFVGTDALGVPIANSTMNFTGDLVADVGVQQAHGVAIHEIGHALGLGHEHQHPGNPFTFDAQAAYNYFSNWSQAQVDGNILNTVSAPWATCPYDKDSIMHYSLHESFVTGPAPYDTQGFLANRTVLSERDINWGKKTYPDKTSSVFGSSPGDVEIRVTCTDSDGDSDTYQTSISLTS